MAEFEDNIKNPSAENSSEHNTDAVSNDGTKIVSDQFPVTDLKKSSTDDFNYLIGDDGFSLEELENKSKEDMALGASRKNAKNSKKPKVKGKFKTVLWAVLICAISVILAFVIILFACEYLGIGPGKGGECTVEIDKGMGTKAIAEKLSEENAINSPLMFRIFCKLGHYDGTFQYGVYTFTNELGYKDIAIMLQTQGAVASNVEVTIPERAGMDDIMKILAEKGVCTKEDFRNAVLNGKYDFDFVEEIPEEDVYYKFEGYLFPDTYMFYNYDSAECAELAIRKMLQATADRLTKDIRAKIESSGHTIHEILTMASIVELEASSAPEEMPKIASVFYNRLTWNDAHLLGSSPTAEYPYGNGRYNTNTHEGLPPGPLCAPSEAALKAAVFPTENFSATYFVTDSEMNFYYNDNLAAHNQTIAKLKSQGKWLG